jgi:hypothetical protein
MWSLMAGPTSSHPSAGKTARPVPPARYAPRLSSRAAGCGCHPKTSTRRSQRPGPGTPVRLACRAISGGLASKARSPKECVRLGCGARGIGACPRPTCSTSRPPLPSISTALSRGSTSAHGHRRAPPVSPPSLLLTLSSQARQPPDVLLRSSLPLHKATRAEPHRFRIFYTTKIIIVSNEQKRSLVAGVWAAIKLLKFKQYCLI